MTEVREFTRGQLQEKIQSLLGNRKSWFQFVSLLKS